MFGKILTKERPAICDGNASKGSFSALFRAKSGIVHCMSAWGLHDLSVAIIVLRVLHESLEKWHTQEWYLKVCLHFIKYREWGHFKGEYELAVQP